MMLPPKFSGMLTTFIFGSMLFATSAVAVPAAVPLPTVGPSTFVVGQEWIWDYSDTAGNPYSTERYRVVEVRGTVVEIEMASTYGRPAGQDVPDEPHHRFVADVARCRRAHANPADPQPWSIELFYRDPTTKQWISSGRQHPLAFEEKFNCDPHFRATPYRDPVEIDFRQGVEAFHARARNGTDRSWYELDGTNAAVAVEKEFHQNGRLTYRFVRR